MIKGKPKLTLEAILSKISQYDIYRYYLGKDFNFRKKVNSPFRKDPDPSLGFKLDASENIIYKDFGDSEYRGDVMNFVMQMYNINYFEALKRIDQDFNLGIHSKAGKTETKDITKGFIQPEYVVSSPKIIQFIPRPFTEEELIYWYQYHITEEELIENNVFSIKKLYFNKTLQPAYGQMRFAYVYDDRVKIYKPFADKEDKWYPNNTPNNCISGIEDIRAKCQKGIQANKLIITKSKKDEIVLKKYFSDVCSTQNESAGAITQENLDLFIQGYGAENVFIFFDNDDPGVKACKYFNQFGFKYINIPKIFLREGITDASDLVKEKGLDTLENYLKIKNLL